MSGPLVGQVIAAAPALKARGVSKAGYMALVAIAEKAHPKTLQASVRWDHIRNGIYGASKRTAQRAVAELVGAGLVVVLSPGFGNRHGSKAPIYRVSHRLDDDKAMTSSSHLDDDKAVTQSSCAATVLDDDKMNLDATKQGSRSRQNEPRRDTHPPLNCGDSQLDVPIDGSFDVPIDGGVALEPKPPTKPRTVRRKTQLPPEWQPPGDLLSKLSEQYPEFDITDQLDAFRDKAEAKGWTYVNWDAAFRDYVRRERRYRQQDNRRNGSNYANNDEKVNGWSVVGTSPHRKELQ